MKAGRLFGAAAGSAVAALLLSSAATAAPSPGPLTLASTPSPFAGCTVGGPGTNYVNAEVEPSVAVKSGSVIGAYQQDRWADVGAHGAVTAYSSNGGATFANSFAPLSTC